MCEEAEGVAHSVRRSDTPANWRAAALGSCWRTVYRCQPGCHRAVHGEETVSASSAHAVASKNWSNGERHCYHRDTCLDHGAWLPSRRKGSGNWRRWCGASSFCTFSMAGRVGRCDLLSTRKRPTATPSAAGRRRMRGAMCAFRKCAAVLHPTDAPLPDDTMTCLGVNVGLSATAKWWCCWSAASCGRHSNRRAYAR